MRVLEKPDTYLAAVFAGMTLGIVIGAPLWTRFSRILGKRRTYVVGASIYALSNLIWLLATPLEGLALLGIR